MIKTLLQDFSHKERMLVVSTGFGVVAFFEQVITFIFQVLDQKQQHCLYEWQQW